MWQRGTCLLVSVVMFCRRESGSFSSESLLSPWLTTIIEEPRSRSGRPLGSAIMFLLYDMTRPSFPVILVSVVALTPWKVRLFVLRTIPVGAPLQCWVKLMLTLMKAWLASLVRPCLVSAPLSFGTLTSVTPSYRSATRCLTELTSVLLSLMFRYT